MNVNAENNNNSNNNINNNIQPMNNTYDETNMVEEMINNKIK